MRIAAWCRWAWLAAAAQCAAGTSALAQTPPAAVAARALLIERAERARDGGDHREALALAERAGRIEMTASLRMFIAEEQLATASFAAAMASALLCGREAARDAQLRARDAILARCREVAQQARASVALLTLRLPADATARVELDGAVVPAEILDVPQPLDPGDHRVVVRVDGRGPAETTFTVRAGESRELALAAGPAIAPAPPDPPPPQRLPTPPAARPAARVPAGAVALVVTGAASVAASAVFFALRTASADGCDIGPDPARPAERVWRCDTPAQIESVGQRPTWTALAATTLGVGLGALGLGVALWIARPPSLRPAASASAQGLWLGVEGSL